MSSDGQDFDGGFEIEDEVAPAKSARSPREARTSEPEEAPAPRRKNPATIIVTVLIALVAAGGFLASRAGTSAQVVNGEITRKYGTGEACTVSNFALNPAGAKELTKDAERIMEALGQVPGIGSASIKPDAGTISVGYCDSTSNPQQIAAVASSAGYTLTLVAE